MSGRHTRARRRAVPTVAVLGLGLALACSNGKQPPLAVRNPLADSADQVLYHTKSVVTDGGVMKAEVHADTAYVFDDNTRVEMRVVRTIFFTATGARNAVLTSQQGTYNTRTNNMEARGDVVVVSEDGRRLTTPVLRYAQGRNEISSDTTFTMTDPERHVSGIGFVSDPDMNNVRCLRACAGSAGFVTLPGGPDDTARVAPPVKVPGTSAAPPGSSGAAPKAGVVPPPGRGAGPAGGRRATTPPGRTTGRATGQVPPGAASRPASAAAGSAPPRAAHPSP